MAVSVRHRAGRGLWRYFRYLVGLSLAAVALAALCEGDLTS
jgi:hypothetical protein